VRLSVSVFIIIMIISITIIQYHSVLHSSLWRWYWFSCTVKRWVLDLVIWYFQLILMVP